MGIRSVVDDTNTISLDPPTRHYKRNWCGVMVETKESQQTYAQYTAFMSGYRYAVNRPSLSQKITRVDEGLPPTKVPVLVLYRGCWRVGALNDSIKHFEDTYPAYQYWDDFYDDGQDWEWYDVTHWTTLLPVPTDYDYQEAVR